MKVYLATFHGDIEYYPVLAENGMKPMADSTLEGLLKRIVEKTHWGEQVICCERICETGTCESVYSGFTTPDPEDDKVEIWEVDGKNIKIVWGFWGWHWQIPEGLEQGILPGHTKSLYEIAINED